MDTPVIPGPGSANDDLRDVEENKDIAAFSYLWIMSVVVYLLKKQSPFVRYHSKQAMVLFVLSIIVWFIPFVNRFLELIILCCMAYGFLSAAQGQRKDVPIVGPLSRGEMTLREAWKELTAVVVRFWTVFLDLAKTQKKAKDTPEAPAQPAAAPDTASQSTPPSPSTESEIRNSPFDSSQGKESEIIPPLS